MADIEKVIKGKEHLDAIMEVATHLNYPDYGVLQDHCLAILALLKEQEAEIERLKKPTAGDNHIPLRW